MFAQKMVQGLHKCTTRYVVFYYGRIIQVNSSRHSKSGSCWSSLAGGHSTQGLFCTNSTIHGILVINTRWSVNTGTINGSFYSMIHATFNFSNCLRCLSYMQETIKINLMQNHPSPSTLPFLKQCPEG